MPRDIISQVYQMVDGLEDYISHTLCYEELTFSHEDQQVYKDLSLLAFNRTQRIEGDDQDPCEIMVIDTKPGEEVSDPQYVTYFQGRPYDGQLGYQNLSYINDALKQYR